MKLSAIYPQTNAAVLDQLTAVASGQMRFTQTSLEETLQLLALWQYLFPKAAIENRFTSLAPKTRRDELAERISHLGIWSTLSGDPIEKVAELTHGRELHFVQSGSEVAVEHRLTNLGTKPKVRHIGRLVLGDHSALHFVPDDELGSNTPKTLEEEIIEQATSLYEVPEIIDDPQLTADINNLIVELLENEPQGNHAKLFNARLRGLINESRERMDGDPGSILRIGSVDLRELSAGSYFKVTGEWNDVLTNVSVHIIARANQDVFSAKKDLEDRTYYLPRLYDCSVQGADTAFKNIGGRKLIAKDCDEAFIGCYPQGIKDSIAISCREAFTNVLAQGCLAANCDVAFYGIRDESKDLIAQFCRVAFYERDRRGYTHRIGRKERTQRNLVVDNATNWRSPLAHYRAGKAFGSPPKFGIRPQ